MVKSIEMRAGILNNLNQGRTTSRRAAVWMIDKFSFYRQNKTLFSSEFTVDVDNLQTIWKLELRPNTKKDGEDCVSVFLYLVKPYPVPKLFASYSFSILNVNKERKNKMEITEDHNFCNGSGWGYDCFIKCDALKNEEVDLLPNGRLTLCCDVTIKTSHMNETVSGQIDLQAPDAELHLSDDLRSLVDNKLFSDVTVVVGESEFPAHKNILSARSSVFAAMFQSNMKESQENRVTIDDITPEAFEMVLEFIYTGKAEDLHQNEQLEMVYYAANKYALEDLKKMCEIELSKKITVENAAKTLIMAELHDGKVLKERTSTFIVSNLSEVMGSQGWEILEGNHQQLAIEILHAIRNGNKT